MKDIQMSNAGHDTSERTQRNIEHTFAKLVSQYICDYIYL